MAESFQSYWPSTAPLTVYADEAVGEPGVSLRRTDAIAGWHQVMSEWMRHPPQPPAWAANPRNYIWDVQRFAVKPFVWLDAAERLREGVLTWLDADTVTTRRVPDGFAADLLGEADVAYLGRKAMHPETGYVGFRLPQALPLLRWCVDAYETGRYREIRSGWTDCHVFRAGLDATGLLARDLTSDQHDGAWRSTVDAFALSPLGPYVTHLKGSARKAQAVSA
jgi:hypothetical protein